MTDRIVISEFMDAPAVERLRARFDVDYRPKLVDDLAALEAALPRADAWIVRNRTPVRGALLRARPLACAWWAGWAWALTTSMSMNASRARSR